MKTFQNFIKESLKQDKSEVDYRPGNQNKHCYICTMFREPNSCTAVKGNIDPNGLCDLFERKKS